MADYLARIPFYPVLPLVFVVAAVLFALQMARHLRILATAHPAMVTDAPERRIGALVRFALLQVRMLREPDAGLMHAAIFWGFVVLTIGTADRVASDSCVPSSGGRSMAGCGGCSS